MRKKKRGRKLLITLVIFIIILGGLNVVKYIFLKRIQARIEARFSFHRMKLGYFPPSLLLEEVRTRSLNPFLSAEKAIVKVSYKSFLKRERPITIFLFRPELRYAWPPQKVLGPERKATRSLDLALPVAVERGVVKEGKVFISREGSLVSLQKVNAFFSQRRGKFEIKMITGESRISWSHFPRSLQGRLSLTVNGDINSAEIKKFIFQGKNVYLKGKGVLSNFSPLEGAFRSDFKIPAEILSVFFGPAYSVKGNLNGWINFRYSSQQWSFEGQGRSNNLYLLQSPLGETEIVFKTNRLVSGEVSLKLKKPGRHWEKVKAQFQQNNWRGKFEGLYLDPIIKLIGLPWPVSSPAWGEFSWRQQKLEAQLEFRDELVLREADRFPFQGEVNLEFLPEGTLHLSSPELTSTFGRVKVRVDLKKNVDVQAEIKGEIRDISQARRLTELALQREFPLPEIGGQAQAEIKIFGSPRLPQVFMSFEAQPGSFDRFEAAKITGEAEVIKNDFFGRFKVEDPHLQGKIGVVVTPQETRVDLRLKKGFLEDVLPALDIFIPLAGEGAGEFIYTQTGSQEKFSGEFSGRELRFAGQILSKVKSELNWENNIFELRNLKLGLYGGQVTGRVAFSQLKKIFEIDLQGQGLQIGHLIPGAKGQAALNLQGKGGFSTDKATGQLTIDDLLIYPFQKTRFKGIVQAEFSTSGLKFDLKGQFEPGDNPLWFSIKIPFKETQLAGRFEGRFSNFNLLLPWKGGQGQLKYLGEVKGSKLQPEVKGAIEIKGQVLPLAKFAHALRDFSGLIFFKNGDFELRSLQGRLGGGQVLGWGKMSLGKTGIQTMDIKAKGENLLLSPWERTRALGDAELDLVKNESEFVLNGEILVKQLLWQREVTEKLSFYSEPYLAERPPGFFDDLDLNLRLRAEDNAWVENSLGRLRARFDLQVVGNIKSPILLGEIETLGGEVYFQDRTFKILKGRIGFYNPEVIEPYISFKGETYVKDYRVTFSLEGSLNRLTPEFSSSPPLPPEDVLALLALGEAFRRTYSYDRSTQLSTASFLSFQLSEEAKKRAERLFSLDRFRIDPFVMGSSAEMTARLTLGKKISRNFSLLYSTNLTAQREELTRIEWEILSDVSIVGMRDEYGRISIEVKIHKRF